MAYCSLRLQAVLDHFGYEVPLYKDWFQDTWYNQDKFNAWFATLRSSRRMKEIMPLMSSTESENEEDDEGTGGPGSGPSTGCSGDETPMPRTPAGSPSVTEDSNKGGETGGAKHAEIVEEVVPHCVIIKGEDGRTYGSYDMYYPFLSTKKKLIPHNPLTHSSNVMHHDFVAAEVDDPRLEDINTIIAVAARGILSKSFKGQIYDRNEEINSDLCPSLEKWNVTRTVTKHGRTAIRAVNVKREVPHEGLCLCHSLL